MNDLILISTILLLVPLNFILVFNLVFQLKQIFVSYNMRSILYTALLAILVIIVSCLIFEILFAESILTETEIII